MHRPTPISTQVAAVRIYDNGYQDGQPMPVYMTTETAGAKIFYTSKASDTVCPPDPTHDEFGNPTGETQVYNASAPPTVGYNQAALFSAVGYKAGLADSAVTYCIYEDNIQQLRPAADPMRTVTYVWDKVGNRTSVTDTAANGGAAQVYLPNQLNQYKQVNGQTVMHGPAHELTSYDSVDYSYMGDTYLAQASAGPSIYTLYYDALGRCVKRVRSEMGVETKTYYHFDGDHWILEYRPDGTVQSNILYGNGVDEIIGRHNEESGVATSYNQWPYPDRNNNTSVVTGDNGTLLEYYRYDAFGQPTIYDPATDAIRTTSAIANRFLFTGREWNPAQKFYEYRNRAYSPSLGRFMSEDPKGFDAGDYNLYRYVGNDPLDKTDPMGLFRVDENGNVQPETTREFVQIANEVEHGDVRDTTPLIDPIDLVSFGVAKLSLLSKAARSSKIAGFIFEGHAVERAVERKVSVAAIEDALKAPLKVTAEKIDELGRPSVKYIGRKATVAVNPKTRKITTINPTGTKKAEKLIKRIDSLIPIRQKSQ